MKRTHRSLLICAAVLTVMTIPVFADSNPNTSDTVVRTVPEPVTITLLAAGLGGVALFRKLRKN